MTRPRFAPGSTAVLTVKNRSGKKLLAGYLASRLGIALPWAEDLLATGCVRLDGSPAGVRDAINLSAGGHTINVHFPEAWPRHMAATEMPLSVIYEDRHILLLDKPAGVVVHPARGHLDNRTLQNGVRHRYRHLLGLPGTTIGPAHRLDKDTSGCVVFALTREAYVNLAAQFAAGTPHKEYLAVTDGAADFSFRLCDGAIGPDPERRGLGRIVPEEAGGKAAVTEFTLLERGADWSVLRAVPRTGRAHQIRVHAAGLGLPLAGDLDYNPNPGRLGFSRQALHAAALRIRHPESGQEMSFASPLAEDISEALERLRDGRKRQ